MAYSESDTRSKLIDPKIKASNWLESNITNGHKIYKYSFPFHIEGTMKPRFYQQIAIQKTIEAIADNSNRVLLTLATGTGKTYITFQTLADRNLLKINL